MTSPPSNHQAPINIVLASRHIPSYVGGLGQYQRVLAEELQSVHGLSGIFLGESPMPNNPPTVDAAGWETKTLFAEEERYRLRKISPSLASRPPFHQALQRLWGLKWGRALESMMGGDVRVVHFAGTGRDFIGFSLLAAARHLGARFTVLPAVHPHDWGDDVIDIKFYNQADTVFALTEFERQHLISKGVRADKLMVCPLFPMCLQGASGDDFRVRHRLGQRPVVLFLGRKDAGKGYQTLLEAWSKVRLRFQDACLVALGPLSKLPLSEIGVERDGILDLGKVSEEEKAAALAACDVFCLPSAHESFGIVFVEAWSYGKPVVCGPAPSTRELVENEVTGLWADQNSESLQHSLTRLLENPSWAAQLGQSGKREQERKYTSAAMLRSHFEGFGFSAGSAANS